MRYVKAKRRRLSHTYEHLYEFGNQAIVAKDDCDTGWLVFFDSDLRWCNMHGFDVKGCNSDPEILGDEDEPTK